jgi:hypothetical protein
MREVLFFFAGAALTWLIVTDLHGNILRYDRTFGIMCRVYGLNAILVDPWTDDRHWLCADLSEAVREDVLWEELVAAIRQETSDE